ncbi:MAG: hypothetical protein SNI32_07350 [Rikenellaceae bacterium]
MKTKIAILLIALLSITTTIFAQEANNSHLEFMGLPITGNVNSFAAKLGAKGFDKLDASAGENIIMLEGTFVNQNVVVLLVYSQKSNEIFRVGVLFEPYNSYEILKNSQINLVELFSKKYGEPTESIREFKSPYNEGSTLVMLGFADEQCKSSDSWLLDNGAIQIQIKGVDSSSAMLMVIYEDTIGTQALVDESLNDI